MEDLDEAGGVYAVMNELCKKGLLNTDCMTVTGRTIGENIEVCANLDPETIRPIDNPFSQTGGIAVLRGNLAPEGSVVKRSAVLPEMLVHEDPARVFDCEEDAQAVSMLESAGEDFGVEDCFDVLKATSRTICPTVVSMVYDAEEHAVYWGEQRNFEHIQRQALWNF